MTLSPNVALANSTPIYHLKELDHTSQSKYENTIKHTNKLQRKIYNEKAIIEFARPHMDNTMSSLLALIGIP